MQTRVDFWIREKDRKAWEFLRNKRDLRPSEIFSKGIQLVYNELNSKEKSNAR